jgi:predicted DNA-binding ribbon-helix-helix protein
MASEQPHGPPAQKESKRPSAIVRRKIVFSGRRTTVSLEDEFWIALKEIAIASGTTRPTLIANVYAQREGINLSSAIRLFILAHYRGSV